MTLKGLGGSADFGGGCVGLDLGPDGRFWPQIGLGRGRSCRFCDVSRRTPVRYFVTSSFKTFGNLRKSRRTRRHPRVTFYQLSDATGLSLDELWQLCLDGRFRARFIRGQWTLTAIEAIRKFNFCVIPANQLDLDLRRELNDASAREAVRIVKAQLEAQKQIQF